MQPPVNSVYYEAIAGEEGYRAHIYTDEFGNQTAGIGINLTAGMTYDEAFGAMQGRVNALYNSLNYTYDFFKSLSPARQYVLLNMGFNMGLAGLMEFHEMFAALQKKDYETAAAQIEASIMARQLPERAARLAYTMRNNVLPPHQPYIHAPASAL